MKKKSSAKKSRITHHASPDSLRPFSSILVDGPERAAARSMLYPVGFTEADFKKPIIGIASTWSNVTPCNMHIDKLALESEKGANELPLRPEQGEGRGDVSKSFSGTILPGCITVNSPVPIELKSTCSARLNSRSNVACSTSEKL